jgi:bacterioferritin-associated ferredoxin
MLVCHCRCVSDRQIRAAICSGAQTVEQVSDLCGAGTGCGGCRELIDEIIAGEAPPPSMSPLIQLRLEEATA